MRANPQCKFLDNACDLFLILKAAFVAEKNLHDTRIQPGLYQYVGGIVHKVVGYLLMVMFPTVIWDRNRIVTMALGGPLPCIVYIGMLTRTSYAVTRLVKLLGDSVTYLGL